MFGIETVLKKKAYFTFLVMICVFMWQSDFGN